MKPQVVAYKALKKIYFNYYFKYSHLRTKLILWLNGVSIPAHFQAKGIPIINVSINGKLFIGNNFSFNSGLLFNMIGRQQRLMIIISNNAVLTIGNNVGISASAIVCQQEITIGNDVMIGGNCVIYDTDFHSIKIKTRKVWRDDILNVRTKAVTIEDGVFVGAHSTILKGVVIGKNSIIGAGSVVTKSVPAGQIWAGNPIKFIREINES